jgi:GNAT superfamily N-acetyltransferase
MAPGVEIRPFEDDDYPACRELWRELTERHRLIYDSPAIGGDDPGSGLDNYLAMSERVATWVAVRDGEIVGLTGLLAKDGAGEVEPVVVTGALRSSGIGTALLEQAIAAARERHMPMLSIRPVARNIEAITLFRRSGFEVLGHLDMFMDLRDDPGPWQPGIEIHGLAFDF